MPRFFTHILPEHLHAGERLQHARERLGLSLTETSQKIMLPIKYIDALERGVWQELPSGGYLINYLKTYSQFLDIAVEPFLAHMAVESSSGPFTPPAAKSLFLKVSQPRRWLFVLVVFLVFSYLGWGAWRKIQPPVLTLISPTSDMYTHEPVVAVTGTTQVGTKVWINNEEVEVTDTGTFSEAVPLRVGINPITIIARRQYRRPLTIVRQIQFTDAITVGSSELTIP